MTDDQLLEGFENATLDAFHHDDHVRVAWIYLGRLGLHGALAAFSEGLKRFAEAHGQAAKYHATVSWFYVVVIHQRMATAGAECGWERFAADNPDVLGDWGAFVKQYYSPETLQSSFARREFVLPDRVPPGGVSRHP
jgi:hypothetical protein